MIRLIPVGLIVVCISTIAAMAEERPITALVPQDALIVYTAKPYPIFAPTTTGPATTQPVGANLNSIASVVTFLSASGLLPDEGQVFADIANALPLLGQFEHALVLLDVSSKTVQIPDDAPSTDDQLSLRLNKLQAAVVFRTAGRQEAVLNQLVRVTNRYTNQEVAKLTVEKSVVKDGTAATVTFPYNRLADSRLIGWAVWEWGRLDDFFVLSFGEGAFDRIAQTYAKKKESLANDAWYKSASAKTNGDQALAQWFIAFERLRKNLGVASEDRVTKVLTILQAEGMTQDLWTIGRQGRALTWFRCYRRNGKEVVQRYSDPTQYSEEHRRIIPDAAENIAVIQVPTRWMVDNLPRAWIAAQSESNADKWRHIWDRLEEEAGTDINGNLISHLGNNVVIFDYPPHPLKIPFVMTMAIQIDDRRAVAVATGALLEAWSRYLDDRAERFKTTLVRLKVKKTDDNIWYLQAGILGPALKVTDHYLVISWSPEALREALKFIERPQMRPDSP